MSPVTAAGFAEVTGLGEVVVVVVTELRVGRVAARTRELLCCRRRIRRYYAVKSHRVGVRRCRHGGEGL